MLGLPLLVLVLWLMGAAGAYWWLWAWGAWMAFQLLVLVLYPTVIAPLFNKFTPMDDSVARERIEALLARCGFRSAGLFVMDGSKRSGHGNAYFTGFGKAKRIVFFDTLLIRLAPEEIEAVLAHELGHFKLRHVAKRIAWSAVLSLAVLGLLAWLAQAPWFYAGLGIPETMLPVAMSRPGVALELFLLVLPVFTFMLEPLSSQYSRRHEFEADAFATRHASAAALTVALVKLYEDNAATLTPDPAAFRVLRLASARRRAHRAHRGARRARPAPARRVNPAPLVLLPRHCVCGRGGAAAGSVRARRREGGQDARRARLCRMPRAEVQAGNGDLHAARPPRDDGVAAPCAGAALQRRAQCRLLPGRRGQRGRIPQRDLLQVQAMSDRAQLSTATLALASMRCRAGAPRLAADELATHLASLPGWQATATAIVKAFEFANYHETMAFVNALAWIAHREDHHPDLSVHYAKCIVTFGTHDAGGTTLNDAICAAKTERLFA